MAPLRRTLRRHEEPGHARYLTHSCYGRLPLFADDAIKTAFADHLARVRHRGGFQLYAWVVMPEHIHLLLTSDLPELTVTRLLRALKRPFAAMVLSRWRQRSAAILERVRDNRGASHFWQDGGGYDRNIFSVNELSEKVTYIHNNPVSRGLVRCATDWPWSSAAWYEKREGLAMDPWPA